MKNRVYLLLIALVSLLSSCSYNNTNATNVISESISNEINTDERVFIKEFGFTDLSNANTIADVNNLEACTELSTHIVLGRIEELTKVSASDTEDLNFTYQVKILDIYMDVNDTLEINDIIPVMSNEGIMKAAEAAELFEHSSWAAKHGILQDEYADNEYILSSNYNAIPIEVGKTYIMMLDESYMDKYNVYVEMGKSFLYEYDNHVVYSGKYRNIHKQTYEEVISMFKSQAKLRTGRADEVGASQYMFELGERQRAEYEQAEAERAAAEKIAE